VTVILQPGKDAKLLATNKLGDGVDASLVALGKQLIIRGEKHLYCIEGE
jgi:outer membrane protein assembly factor BamB